MSQYSSGSMTRPPQAPSQPQFSVSPPEPQYSMPPQARPHQSQPPMQLQPQPQQPQLYQQQYSSPQPQPRYSPYQAARQCSGGGSGNNSVAFNPQPIVQNISPTVFNPSPISNDKLAIFESRYQPQNEPPQPARRPLTVPNTIVRNQSPTPYGNSAPPFIAKSVNFQKTSPPPPQSPYQMSGGGNQNRPKPIYNDDASYITSSPSGGGGYHRAGVDFGQCENYNRAARGWGQMKDYYRPITFTKPKVELPYTDF